MTAPAAAPASGPIAPAAPRAPPQPQADRFAFAVVLELASRRANESGRLDRRGTAALFERARTGRVHARTAGSPFAAERQLAPGVLAVRPAGIFDGGPRSASRGQFAFTKNACDEGAEIRGQRLIPRCGGQGGDCWAADWRTGFSLWRLPFPGRDHEPRSPGRQAVRTGLRLRRQSYVPIRSKREKRPRRWLPGA